MEISILCNIRNVKGRLRTIILTIVNSKKRRFYYSAFTCLLTEEAFCIC